MTRWHSFPVVLVELQFTLDQDNKFSQEGQCPNLGYMDLHKWTKIVDDYQQQINER